MSSLLDVYLDEVAAQLDALPVKRRSEELHEMRQHLLNAVTVNRERGQSEDDAVANAVQQFGTPKDLGNNLVWAWQREQMLNKRNFWGAATCTFVLLFLAALLQAPFVRACYDFVGPAHPLIMQHLLIAFELFGPLMAGIFAGSLFSRRGTVGNAFGVLAYSALCICVYAYWLVQPGNPHRLGQVPSTMIALRFLAPLVLDGFIVVGTAWISSRVRQAWNVRKQLVRG